MVKKFGLIAVAAAWVIAAGDSFAQDVIASEVSTTTAELSAEPTSAVEAPTIPTTTTELVSIPVPSRKLDPVAKTEESPAQTSRIEALVVTAQKREQSINDVPISISAFSGEDLANLGLTDIRDIGSLVPALSVNDSGQGTPIYTLRGVGFNETTYTATGTVGLYVDEVNLPYSAMSKGLSVDLERVEVLKGPQGTLYGRNTTGGLINQIANKPTRTFEAGATVSYSRFKTTDGEVFISGPFTDTVAGRLAIRAENADEGWQYSNTRPNDTLGKVRKYSGRGSLEWKPNDDLDVRLVLEKWKDHSQPQAPQAVGLNPQNGILGSAALSPRVSGYPLVSQQGADPQVADWNPDRDWKRNDNFFSQALRADWKFTDSTQLTTLLSHMRVEANGSDDIQSGFDFYNLESSTTAFIDTTAIETRLAGKWGDSLNWLFGVNASKDRASEDHYVLIDTESAFFPITPAALVTVLNGLAAQGLNLGAIAAGTPGIPAQYSGILESVQNGGSPLTNRFHSQGRSETRQYAAFANADWAFVDTLSLNLGARYTRNQQDFAGCSREAPESVGLGASNLSTVLSILNAAQYTAQTGQPGRPSIAQKGDCFSVGADGNHDEFQDTLAEHNISGRVALSWKPATEYLFYTSVSRGFKAGGFPVLNACCQYQFTPTTQEELLATEVGTKLSWWDRRLQTNFAAYYYDYKDKQLLTKQKDPIFGPLPVLRNAPRSHVFGAELDLQARPLYGLFLQVAGSYTETQIDEFVSTNDAGQTQDFAGKPFNFSPRYEVNALADYTWAIYEWNLGVGVDAQRTGDTNGTLAQTQAYDMPAYTLLGARIHLQSPNQRWTAALFGRNLTNEFYSTASFNIGDSIARFAGRPRTYGVTLGYSFN
jgi:outer membrane receptor protein involved in Fe transport